MKLGLNARNYQSVTNQVSLRQKYETNMDLITDIFSNTTEDNYEVLVPEIIKIYEDANPYLNKELLKKSVSFSIKSHLGQYRDSGVPAASHPIQAGYLITEFGFTEDAIATANLHDVIEDCDDILAFMNKILADFGQTVFAGVYAISVFDESETRDKTKLDSIVSATKKLNLGWLLPVYAADGITNLFTKKHMIAKKGLTAKERQAVFANNMGTHVLPIAEYLDEQGTIDFKLAPYIKELINR